MPGAPGIDLGVRVRVDPHDARMARQVGIGGVRMGCAEMLPEGRELVDRQVLVSKEDHQVIHQRVVDGLDRRLLQGPGQVDAANLGADGRRQGFDRQGALGHGPGSTGGEAKRLSTV